MSSADNHCQDQARQNIGPDLDPNCETLMLIRKEFFKKFDLKKNQWMPKKHAKMTQYAKSYNQSTVKPV